MRINPHWLDNISGFYISDQIAWHGDNVEAVRSVLGQMLVDNILLPKAADLDADMVVMGPYGRSCVCEFIVGVASCDILECMTVLVFMSHSRESTVVLPCISGSYGIHLVW